MNLLNSSESKKFLPKIAVFFLFLIFVFIQTEVVLAQQAHSVDAILVYEELVNNNVQYLFRGHTPAIPNNDAGNPGPITGWNWFSGDPAAPTLDTPGTIGQGSPGSWPFPAMPKVAFSREGYAIVVYTRFTKTGQINCGTPEDPFLKEKRKGDLRWALYRDGTAGIADQGTIVAAVENEYHVAPSVAIDNNGQGLAIWYHVIESDPCENNTTSGIHFSRWDGDTSTWTADTHIDGTANHTGAPLGDGTFHTLNQLSTALNFNAVVVDPATAPITRQQAVAVWYDYIDLRGEICPGNPVPREVILQTFWPRYSVWDGDSWSAPALIPDPPDKWKSFVVRGKLDISSDQKGNSVLVWPVRKITNVCMMGMTEEVWSARHQGSDNTWPKKAAKYNNGMDTSVAFDTGNDNIFGPDQQRATVYFSGLPPELFVVKRNFYSTMDDIWSVGENLEIPPGAQLTNAYLPHFRRLLVYQSSPEAIINWYDEDRVANTTTKGDIEMGEHPDLAARGGGTTIPHARWSTISYGAGDDASQDPQMRLNMERVQEVGSTNLISWVYHRDRSALDTRSYYLKRGARQEIRDWRANLNFGAQATLRDTIAWDKEFYPGDKYILDLEDHGEGWQGTCIDGGGDWVQIPELKGGIHDGLQDAVDEPIFGQTLKFSHVYFHPCLMSMVEVAYQLNGLADFMVASGELTPNISTGVFAARGTRYQNILQRMVDNPFISDQDLAHFVVDDYQAANGGVVVAPIDHELNFSSIRVQEVPTLVDALNQLAQDVVAYVNPGTAGAVGRAATIRGHRNASIVMDGNNTFRDLFDFAQRLSADGALPVALRNAATAVGTHKANVVTRVWSDVNRAGWNGLNIWLETAGAVLLTGGANSPLSTQYLATDFGTNAPNWHRMLLAIRSTPGLSVLLTSSGGKLFVRVSDSAGNEVGFLQDGHWNCGSFCGIEIPDASCSQNMDGNSQIFIPNATGQYTWVVDGALIQASANFTLTIQELADDGSVLQQQIVNGTVNPGQTNQGAFTIGPVDTDADADGVPDKTDNCPQIANPGQADLDQDGIGDACDTDLDGDGIANSADNCLLVANPSQEDKDKNGVGDACNQAEDKDGDDWADLLDNCPIKSNPLQEDTDADTLGDACDTCPQDSENDKDNDVICGNIDNCPQVSNPDQNDTDKDNIGTVCDVCPLDATNTCDVTESVSETVGVAGGTVEINSKNAKVNIPSNALPQDTSVFIVGADRIPSQSISDFENQTGYDALSLIYTFGPQDTSFTTPATLNLKYRDAGVAENAVDIFLFNPASVVWQKQSAQCDIAVNACTLRVSHFSDYIVGGYPDTDGDGIADPQDNCPNVANPDQKDTNQNGIGDACEVVEFAFRRGDSNGDETVDISDAINTLGFLFLGTGTINCQDAGDANDDGTVDISDAVYTLQWLFTGGAIPPDPGPFTVGVDPTNDALSCNQYPLGGGGGGGGGSVKETADAINKSSYDQQTKDNFKNVLNIVPKGTLYAAPSPSAYLYIDGKYKGYTPLTIKDLYEGSYTVKFTKYNYETYQTTVKILPGQTTTVKPTLKPLPSPTPSPSPSPNPTPFPSPAYSY